MSKLNFKCLIGHTITNIEINDIEDEMIIRTESADYKLYHVQDCCEEVRISEIIGDLKDVIGSPVLDASLETNKQERDEFDHCTWSFYKLSTIKGSVTIRWLGESNGYYSEEVTFERIS